MKLHCIWIDPTFSDWYPYKEREILRYRDMDETDTQGKKKPHEYRGRDWNYATTS